MNRAPHKRLVKLRRKRRPAERTVILWYDAAKETAAQATARRFPKGVPPQVRLLILRWLTKGESAPADGAQPPP